MRTFIRYSALLLLLVTLALGAEDAVTAIHGTITKVDRAAKTVVVKTADGTEHTLHFAGKTTVRGADLTARGANRVVPWSQRGYGSSRALRQKGRERHRRRIRQSGKDGLKGTEGTISVVDRTGKKIAVTTADGTKQTFKLFRSRSARCRHGHWQRKREGNKVIVYSSEDAGKKVAHS